jgi:hypothetical protein
MCREAERQRGREAERRRDREPEMRSDIIAGTQKEAESER